MRRHTTALMSVGLFFLTLALFSISFKRYFYGGQSYEFCHYGEIASHIVQGRGFVTDTFTPSDVAYLEKLGISIHSAPPLGRYAVFSYWTAFWYWLGGQSDYAVALGNGVAHALWVALVFVTGLWLFGFWVGLIAALFWLVQPYLILGFDQLAYPDVLFGVLFNLFNIFWWKFILQREEKKYIDVLMGIFACVLYLTRNNFIVWIPIYLCSLVAVKKQLLVQRTLCMLIGFALPFFPYTAFCIKNAHLLIPPLLFWHLTYNSSLAGAGWGDYRTFSAHDLAAASFVKSIFSKIQNNVHNYLPDVIGMWLQPFFFPFLWIFYATTKSDSARYLRWLLLLFIWQFALFLMLRYENLGYLGSGRYFMWFAPCAVIATVEFFLKRWSFITWRVGFCSLSCLILLSWAGYYRHLPTTADHASGKPINAWPEIIAIREAVPQGSMVMTNLPAQITWYSKRPTLALPNNPDDVKGLSEKLKIDYLFLSRHRLGEIYNYTEWQPLLTGQKGLSLKQVFDSMGFTLEKQFEEGLLLKKIKT